MSNVTTLLDAKSVPEAKAALICPSRNETYSYKRLRDEMNRVGLGLLSLGVKKGDRVCIYLDSSPEYLISYFAIWRIGAVAVPTNIVYRGKELLHVINDAGACTVITDLQGAGIIGTIRKEAPTISHIICTGGACDGSVAWDSFPPVPENTRAANCSTEDLCHIQYTAGTTGQAQGCHAHPRQLDDRPRYRAGRPPSPPGRCLPRDLSHGACRAVMGTCRHPGRGYLRDDGAVRASNGISRLPGSTRSPCLPVCRRSSTRSSTPRPARKNRLATARVIISGGGQLLPVVWEAFDKRYHIPVANSYGLSETIVIGSGTTTLPEYPHLTKDYQSVGVAVGYTEIRIVDTGDPERELPYGECGEVALRGPAVAKGYWNLPEATREVFRPDGWFLTGDIGYLDPEGILCITDRKKDMIIMSGWKIYPTEVENVIIQHPAVADVAVFGVPDERKGEVPVAAIVFRPGMTLDEKELEAYCRDQMAGYKIPRKIMVTGFTAPGPRVETPPP